MHYNYSSVIVTDTLFTCNTTSCNSIMIIQILIKKKYSLIIRTLPWVRSINKPDKTVKNLMIDTFIKFMIIWWYLPPCYLVTLPTSSYTFIFFSNSLCEYRIFLQNSRVHLLLFFLNTKTCIACITCCMCRSVFLVVTLC